MCDEALTQAPRCLSSGFPGGPPASFQLNAPFDQLVGPRAGEERSLLPHCLEVIWGMGDFTSGGREHVRGEVPAKRPPAVPRKRREFTCPRLAQGLVEATHAGSSRVWGGRRSREGESSIPAGGSRRMWSLQLQGAAPRPEWVPLEWPYEETVRRVTAELSACRTRLMLFTAAQPPGGGAAVTQKGKLRFRGLNSQTSHRLAAGDLALK